MAEGRMLRRKIALDKRLARLSRDRTRLFFTWCIPFLDVEGRMTGDPEVVKVMAFPLLKTFTTKTITQDIAECARLGLVQTYVVNGERYLYFPGFPKNQQLRKDREGKSTIPPPPDNAGICPGPFPERSGSTLAEVKLSEEKENEGPRKRSQNPTADDLAPEASKTHGEGDGHATWLTEASGVWRHAYGGEFPFKKAAKFLKLVVDAVGHDEMVRRLKQYASVTPAQFSSLAKFAETHGSYTGVMADPRQTSGVTPPSSDFHSEVERLRRLEDDIARERAAKAGDGDP